MALTGTVPRRCVNLPPGSLLTLMRCALTGKAQEGPDLEAFYQEFAQWLGVKHVFGGAQGRSVFQLGLEALGMEKGKESRAGGEPPAVNVTGSWDLTIEAEGEAIQGKLEMEQEGAEVTGTMVSPFGQANITSGIVSGNDLELTIEFNMGGESMEVEITGTVEGDSASGTGDSPMASFTWTAKRTPGGETDR